MKRISLRVRLVLWTVVLEAVLLFIFAVVFILVLRNTQYQQIEETLRLGAKELNAVIEIHDENFTAAAIDTADLESREIMAWIFTQDGRLGLTIGSTDNFPVPPSLPPFGEILDWTVAKKVVVRLFTAPLTKGGTIQGTIVLGLPLRGSQNAIGQTMLGLAITIPVVLLLSAGGGLFLAGRALQPVAAITHTAQQISAADLSQRIGLELPDDEIGRLAHTFNAMLKRLEWAFQHERKLTSDVSHELRTPLGMMKTQLSLARSRPRDTATLLKMMAETEEDVDRMTHLVEQMLTLARIEQRGLSNFTPVALCELLTEITAIFQPRANDHQIQLSLVMPPQINLEIMGDVGSLRQVFTNLIENGLKYTPAGGQVTVKLDQAKSCALVLVIDSGEGIPPEHLPHLFDRFFRADGARGRDTGGSGLGLAIVQAIVQTHNGTITVTSESGKGSVFTVSLPVIPGSAGWKLAQQHIGAVKPGYVPATDGPERPGARS